eukprot:jgi/Mesen1/1874/ME000143S00928
MLTAAALFTSLGTSFVIFLLLVVAFLYLAQLSANEVIYFPARILASGSEPQKFFRQRPLGAWLVTSLRTSEEEVLRTAGLDAAVYLQFLRTCFKIMLWCSFICLGLLLPICSADTFYRDFNMEHDESLSEQLKYFNMDTLTMGNLQPSSPQIWAFIVGAYWVSLATCYFLSAAHKNVLYLRMLHLKRHSARPEQFVVMARDIPRPPNGNGPTSRQAQAEAFFASQGVKSFQQALVFGNLDKVVELWEELERCKRQLAHAEALAAAPPGSFSLGLSEAHKPHHRLGFLGLLGPRVDSVSYWSNKVYDLSSKLQAEQQHASSVDVNSAPSAGAFGFFADRFEAAEVACAAGQGQKGDNTWHIVAAPEPRNVVHENLAVPSETRARRQLVVAGIVFGTICFYMVPITFISAFTTLHNLVKTLPFLKGLVNMTGLRTALEAYLPQTALLLFMMALPGYLSRLSKFEGYPTRSGIACAAAGKLFYFAVLNNFVGVSVGGGLFGALEQMLVQPSRVVDVLGTSIPQNASFFISFVALKFLVGYGLEVSRVIPLAFYHARRLYACKTPQEHRDAWLPGGVDYAAHVPTDLLVMLLGLCYAVIAPAIAPFVVLHFALAWLIMKHQILNVYVPSYESGGRMWPFIHTRMLASLLVAQLTMIAYFGIKRTYGSVLLLPLPLLTLAYHQFSRASFSKAFDVTPLNLAGEENVEVPALDKLVEAYTPESMKPVVGSGPDYGEGGDKLVDAV